MKYWEIIVDNLKKTGFSVGWASALDKKAAQSGFWMHNATESGFIVRGDEISIAFVELQRAIQKYAVSLIS